MTDQGKKSSIQALAAGFLGFTVVVGVGSFLIFHRGGAAEAPSSSYAPVDADSGMPMPSRPANPAPTSAPLGGSVSSASSPAPLLSDDVRDQDPAPAAAAPSAAAAPGATPAMNGPATMTTPKLVIGQQFGAAASASSSASTSVAAAPKAKAPSAAAKKKMMTPKLNLSRNMGNIASSVHYGVSDRAELMGRAAGPVYNFSGKNFGGQRGAQSAPNAGQAPTTSVAAAGSAQSAGAIQQMNAAQKQLDASNDVPVDDKTKLDQSLNQARQTAAFVPAGQ